MTLEKPSSEQRKSYDCERRRVENALRDACIAARHQLLGVLGLVTHYEHRAHVERAISLCDAALACGDCGGTGILSLPRKKFRCGRCNGTGVHQPACVECGGLGQKLFMHGGGLSGLTTCDRCRGTGTAQENVND